jgi:rare lipoprotein A
MITHVNAGNIFYGGWLAIVVMISALSGCAEKESDADLKSKEKSQPTYKEVGEASWYGPGFHGRKTASGDIFDQRDMTAAHPTLPLGTDVEVTNLENKKKVEVEITDRGPYAKDRAIDLSKAAAKKLDMKEEGVSQVKIVATEPIKKKSQAGKSSKKAKKKRTSSTKNKK